MFTKPPVKTKRECRAPAAPASAPGCVHARECPISKEPCPGQCVFAGVMQSVTLGIVLFDTLERKIVFQNAEAKELFWGAVAPSDYDGLHALLISPAGALSALRPSFPPPLRVEGRLLGYTVYYDGGRFIWLFVRDISEKVRLEAVAEAVELMNNIGYVFSTVRHELGNPVNSIKTALTVLRKNIDGFPPESVLDYVDRCLAELGRVEELLGSLRNFSVYEDFRIRVVELEPFVRKTLALVSPEFERRGIRLSITLAPQAREGTFDARALRQVLLNLLTNAADALQGRPRPEIRVRTSALPGLIAIQIEDNGCGMSEEQKRLLFKPFCSSKPNGTGLGLVIAKRMLAKMNGIVEVESGLGAGTVVTLTLPGVADG